MPAAELNEPVPIDAVSDDAARLQTRKGFEPGKRKHPSGEAVGGTYVEDPAKPEAGFPTTTTPQLDDLHHRLRRRHTTTDGGRGGQAVNH